MRRGSGGTPESGGWPGEAGKRTRARALQAALEALLAGRRGETGVDTGIHRAVNAFPFRHSFPTNSLLR